MRSIITLILVSLINCLCMTVAGQHQSATKRIDEFKILTEVLWGTDKQLISRNETLFSNGQVFDFRFIPGQDTVVEASIYKPENRTFVLLDYKRQQRLELDSLQLLRVVDGLKSEILANERLKPLFLDNFTEKTGDNGHRASVSNAIVSYVAQGKQPDDDTILPLYFQFLDHFTLVGATNPQALPPFPRIQLNQVVKRLGMFPDKIDLRVRANEVWETDIRAQSNHRLVWQLDPSDHAMIAESQENRAQFNQVDLGLYRKIQIAESPASAVKR